MQSFALKANFQHVCLEDSIDNHNIPPLLWDLIKLVVLKLYWQISEFLPCAMFFEETQAHKLFNSSKSDQYADFRRKMTLIEFLKRSLHLYLDIILIVYSFHLVTCAYCSIQNKTYM